ncbi:MAG: hypothetical protein ACI8ZB_003833 [Desulforhopalus sp.]
MRTNQNVSNLLREQSLKLPSLSFSIGSLHLTTLLFFITIYSCIGLNSLAVAQPAASKMVNAAEQGNLSELQSLLAKGVVERSRSAAEKTSNHVYFL